MIMKIVQITTLPGKTVVYMVPKDYTWEDLYILYIMNGGKPANTLGVMYEIRGFVDGAYRTINMHSIIEDDGKMLLISSIRGD